MLVIIVMFAGYDATSKFLSPRYPVSELLWIRYITHVLLLLTFFGPKMRWGLIRTTRPLLQIIRASMLVVVSFDHVRPALHFAGRMTAYRLSLLLVTALFTAGVERKSNQTAVGGRRFWLYRRAGDRAFQRLGAESGHAFRWARQYATRSIRLFD